MQTQMELNRKIDEFLGQHLSTDQQMFASRALLEFRATPDIFSRQGISEADYVRSRLIDEGLASLQPGSTTKPDQRPGWQRNPLIPMRPQGNEVGSLDPVSIT